MTEIAAIVGPAGAAILTMLILRFTHFEKAVTDFQDKVNERIKDADMTLNNEIKKGENANVREIKEIVKRLSSLETMLSASERIGNRLSAFRFDFVSLGLITIMVIIAAFAPQLDAGIIIIMAFMGYFVFLDIYNFMANVQELQNIKRKFRKGDV